MTRTWTLFGADLTWLAPTIQAGTSVATSIVAVIPKRKKKRLKHKVSSAPSEEEAEDERDWKPWIAAGVGVLVLGGALFVGKREKAKRAA